MRASIFPVAVSEASQNQMEGVQGRPFGALQREVTGAIQKHALLPEQHVPASRQPQEGGSHTSKA